MAGFDRQGSCVAWEPIQGRERPTLDRQWIGLIAQQAGGFSGTEGNLEAIQSASQAGPAPLEVSFFTRPAVEKRSSLVKLREVKERPAFGGCKKSPGDVPEVDRPAV